MKLNVQEPYFTEIMRGKKVVEGRLAKEKYLALKPGDEIEINGEVIVVCKAIYRYNSFEELLKSEGLKRVLPSVSELEKGIAVYRQFYSKEEEQRWGVVGIVIKLKEQDAS